jgi:hypothetical protein
MELKFDKCSYYINNEGFWLSLRVVDVNQAKEFINNMQDKLYIAILKVFRNKRSLDANAYFHVLVNKLARRFNLSDEEMKIKINLNYGAIAKFDDGRIKGCKVPEGTDMKEFYKYSQWYKEEGGFDCYIFYKETHTLNTLEMSQLIDGVVQECKDCGIETLPPEKLKAMKEAWGSEAQKNKSNGNTQKS